jgi:hypothetical protein
MSIFVIAATAVLALLEVRNRRRRNAAGKTPGRWEVALSDDGEMVHVRWSLPDEKGRYLWVRHYPASAWGLHAAEREAARYNADGMRVEQCRPWGIVDEEK